MNGNHHSVQRLLEELKGLLPAQFEELLLVLKVPVEYLPSREAAQAIRAVDLIRWAEKAEVLDRLEVELNRFRPQPSPVSDIAPETKVVPPTSQPKTFVNSIGMEFVLVPAGEFLMGSNKKDNELPIHKVIIETPFYLGKYQVTQREWMVVMGENPSYFNYKGNDRLPVEQVSWNDCQNFLKKLNSMQKDSVYRLPSESEWEYACRAGTTEDYAGNLDEMAWFGAVIRGTLRKWNRHDNIGFPGFVWALMRVIAATASSRSVGLKKANGFGLYDMHGNLWEWCQDRWHDNYEGAPTDGTVWETGNDGRRVLRGGSWDSTSEICRSAYRYGVNPTNEDLNIGFRVVALRH